MNNIENFLDSTGKIKNWPSRHNLKLEILKYLAGKFEYDRFYTEKEINNIIDSYHTFGDYFLLRRELIESRQMSRTRDGAKYWRTEDNAKEQVGTGDTGDAY